MSASNNTFSFYLSRDLNLPVRIKIVSLEGNIKLLQSIIIDSAKNYNCVPYSVLSETSSFNSVPYLSLYISVQLYANGKPITLPINSPFSSFSSQSYRWDEVIEFPVKYRDLPLSTIVVFTIKAIVAPRKKIDVGGTTFSLFGKKKTLKQGRQKLYVWPGVSGDGSGNPSSTPGRCPHGQNEMDKIERLIKKFETQEIPRVDWLDKFVGKAIEKVHEESLKSMNISLFVTTPDFPYPVVFYQKPANSAKENNLNIAINNSNEQSNSLMTIYDPELSNVNPVEEKHIMLTRGRRRGQYLDPDLKPNAEEKENLQKITTYPPTHHLNSDDQELLWKFRFYLRSNKKAMTKFLKCVDWTKPSEVAEASKLMETWAEIDIDDALELLSLQFKDNTLVRSYAVTRLAKTTNEELSLFLLQLVQALRYDNTNDSNNNNNNSETSSSSSSTSSTSSSSSSSSSDLNKFLLSRAMQSDVIGIQLYWYLTVEARNPIFKKILNDFLSELKKQPMGSRLSDIQNEQQILVDKLAKMSNFLRESGWPRPKKEEKVKKMLSKNGGGEFSHLASFKPIPLPLHPQVFVTGIKEDVVIFKSAMQPLLFSFNTKEPYNNKNEYKVIYKYGDDLRQDQLVVQLISLMDQLFKKENLDLCLTPYKVLATSNSDGMLQAVPDCKNVADVINKYKTNSILSFLKEHHPDKSGPYNIKASALDRFLRSCAGYCVITYILGIGDRHLDNLLITTNGELFHIDFGFILGRDPKPLPPPMKVSPEMVEGMGGLYSKEFKQFTSYCCTAYNILRKSSNLILNLISLMVDAEIPHVNQGEKSVLKIQEKFKLELTDEEANRVMIQLITESVKAVVANFMEDLHRWRKYWMS
eukprot:TRINITY_DN653_c0_g4_i1.p1 TRINITY_DN653_c0_g4~~TRINITY_DN653_c0_g4_i1.p1  ORF type:complete len:866 (+),score=208.78 TRINITY_DN653_c0_g4_i1:55-2652(+)